MPQASEGGVTWLPPIDDDTLRFEDAAGKLWYVELNDCGEQWMVDPETKERTLMARTVHHYGPGGEYLPDGKPAIRMEPQGFLARFLYAWRAARPKG